MTNPSATQSVADLDTRTLASMASMNGAVALRELLDRVGAAGEQSIADEERYFTPLSEQPNKSRYNAYSIDIVLARADGSALLVGMADRTYYKRHLRSSRIDAFLVLRDTTTGERHVLRVAPKFCRYTSAEWSKRGGGDPEQLIHAATAWTFGLKPEQYHPDLSA